MPAVAGKPARREPCQKFLQLEVKISSSQVGNPVKGKADDLYRGSMQFVNHRRTALQYPLVHWTLCRCQQYGAFSMKALAR